MTSWTIRLSWFLLGSFWMTALGVAEPLHLEFEVRRSTPGVQAQKIPESLNVILGDDYLEFEDDDGRVVHDFVSRQSHLVAEGRYARRSLYADIGFRVAEFRNRMELIAALRQTHPERTQGQIIEVEHLFGIDDEETEAPIVREEAPEKLVFRFQDSLMAEFSLKGRKLTPAHSQEFVRFLRYYVGGHPDILAQLQIQSRLPRDSDLVMKNLDKTESVKLHLVKVGEEKRVRPDFSQRSPDVFPVDPLGALARLALGFDPELVVKSAQDALSKGEQAFVEGRLLPSALFFFEAYLMEGGDLPAQIVTNREAFQADPETALLFTSLIGETEEQARRSVSRLKSLEPKAGEASHVLKIFQAGLLLQIKEAVAARDLFLEALVVNPIIASSWMDLGDVYFSEFQADIAWLCWDIGRRLAPEHQMSEKVNRLEESLRSNYPGFF